MALFLSGSRPVCFSILASGADHTLPTNIVPAAHEDRRTMDQEHTISMSDIVSILDRILARVASRVAQGSRGHVANERFLHHMFSTELDRLCSKHGLDMWDAGILIPECPSADAFSRDQIDLGDVGSTRQKALRAGRRGNIDFHIDSGCGVGVEWKGPKLCSEKALAEAFLKLLMEEGTLKVLAVFLTGSTTGRRNHLPAVQRRMIRALRFAMEVLEIESLAQCGLHAFVATALDSGVVKLHWGPVLMADSLCLGVAPVAVRT